MIGGTVPYAATLKSWMADNSTAGDRQYGQNAAIIGKFTLVTSAIVRKLQLSELEVSKTGSICSFH